MVDAGPPLKPTDLLPSQRRGSGPPVFFATLIAILSLFVYLFWTSYQTSRRAALTTVNNLVDVLASNLDGALNRVKSDLRVIVSQITADDLSGHATAARRADLEARMSFHLRGFPVVVNYRVFDAKGQTLFGAGSANPHAAFNVADRSWFQQLRDDSGRDVVFSEVVTGKGTLDQTIIMAIPIRDGEGRFLGAVNAAINLAYFQQLIDSLNIGQNGLVVLRRTDDYRLLLRRPQMLDLLNEPLKQGELSERILSGQDHGEGEVAFAVDHIKRSYAFCALHDYPVSVIVAVAVEDYLALWRKQTGLSGMVALVMIVTLMMLYRRQLAAQDRLNALAKALKNSEADVRRSEERFKEQARTDSLTGLANRRAFIEAAETEFQRGKRFGSAASVLMIDIDHFKQVNDSRGHRAGDCALVSLATILKTMARATDLPARFGGEEFVLLLVGTDLAGATEMAERIRMAAAQNVVASPSGDFGFTVSIGVAPFVYEGKEWSDAMSRADEGMYRAKALGRNRVVAVGGGHLVQ